MKVYGTEITDAQLEAGRAAMVGNFTMHDITVALIRAGVTSDGPTAGRAVDRLLQKERKAGHIRAVNNKNWIVA